MYCSKSVDGAPTFLHTSLNDAIGHLQRVDLTIPLNRAFVIGGAGLYEDALALPTSGQASVNRVLLTRVLEPAFDDCDVFMPAFEQEGLWQLAPHAELVQWVGHDVPEGKQMENGVEYEFQMWVKDGGA